MLNLTHRQTNTVRDTTDRSTHASATALASVISTKTTTRTVDERRRRNVDDRNVWPNVQYGYGY